MAAERYAKARMLPQREARDSRVRALFDALPDRAAALGAVVLYHRVRSRMDVRGAVIFEPAWLRSECFLGYPVEEAEVAMWADALVGREVGLLEEYRVDGIRYAWDPSFYDDNPGLMLQHEEPRYPCPPGWDFDRLWPDDRPGRKPARPPWAAGDRPTRTEREQMAPPTPNVIGGVAVRDATGPIAKAIERMEGALGEEVTVAVRRYALQFADEMERAEEWIPAGRYHAVLATLHKWKQDGGCHHRGAIRWDDERFTAAFRAVGELVLEGRMKNHRYAQELLADPEFPPKEGEKPATAPEGGSKRPKPSDPDAAAKEQAALERMRRTAADRAEKEKTEWVGRVDSWLAVHGDRLSALRQQATTEMDASLAAMPAGVQERMIQSRVRSLAAVEAGIQAPKGGGNGKHE